MTDKDAEAVDAKMTQCVAELAGILPKGYQVTILVRAADGDRHRVKTNEKPADMGAVAGIFHLTAETAAATVAALN